MKKLLLIILLVGFGSYGAYSQCAANFSTIMMGGTGVAFINYSYGDSLAGPLNYQWDFGDGNIDTQVNPIHTYPAPGTYNACLIMADMSGCSDTFCTAVVVIPPTPTLSVYFITDSMGMYACIAPASVNFYYGASAGGFSPPDTVFDVHVVWGDGSDSTWQYYGTGGIQGMLTHSYTNAGTYTPQMTISGANGTVTSSQAGMSVIVAASCGSVSGHVYNDLNNNCVFDAGEEIAGIPVMISITGGQMAGWTNTDANGLYSFNVPTGTNYDIHVQTNNGWMGTQTPSCPASGTISITSVPSTGNDFGLTCLPGADVTGSLSGWRFRPGFEGSICVFAYNARCLASSGQIEITLDSDLTPLPDTAGIGYTINGQTVTYTFTGSTSYWSFCFPFMTSVNAQIGDTVCITMNITASGDSDLSNNSGTYCFPIRNSFDPNDKSVTPAGAGSSAAILPNTELTYNVRFQNTGSDVAYNVYILDSLDADLDVTTLEVIASSHPMTHTVLAGNVVRFNFDNIMLADSVSNEPASHGYVTYKIKPLSNVANGATITNMAGIYFDFNQPILTNTTLNTIDYFLAVPVPVTLADFALYPNPASNNVSIRFADNSVRKITLSDALGKVIYHSTATDFININTAGFAPGIYTLHVVEGSTNQTRKLVINHN